MNRIMKLFLSATLFLLVCFMGLFWAQQGLIAAAPVKESGKSVEGENALDIAAKRQEQREKVREEVFAKWDQQLGELKKQKRDIQSKQRSLREEISKRCGMSPENVVPSLLNIERELLTARIELGVKQRSNEVLANLINDARENAKKNLGNDQVLKNLTELVDHRENALKVSENTPITGTSQFQLYDVFKLKAELSEAKIRLAMREEELTKNNGEDGAAKLYLLMRENSLAVAQIEVRLNFLLKEREQLGYARNLVDEYTDITESELPRLNRQIDRMSEKLLDESQMMQANMEYNSRYNKERDK
jgi:hypothetical protein